MANGVRTIYSPRQRMAPGQYETPLADFLEKVPNYILQFEEMKLARDRQQLQEKRYENSVNRQNRLDNEAKSQREYTNELNLFKLLPEPARVDAYSTSKNPRVRAAGEKAKVSRQAFVDQLSPVGTDWADNPAGEITHLENLLSDPSISPYSGRVQQIEDRIGRLKPKVARQQINKWIEENPNDSRVSALRIQAQTDPEGAVKALMPARTTMSTTQKQVWNPFTKEYSFATNQEIAAAKATETTEDDIIPISGAPRQGRDLGTKELPSIIKTIESLKKSIRRIREPSDGSPLDANVRAKKDTLEKRLLELEDLRYSILLGQTSQAKKAIPGF